MEDCGVGGERAKFLHKETDELISIFTTIVAKVRRGLSEKLKFGNAEKLR